ncbi:sugar transferase [Acidipila rosea]|uniref:Undecaprenyl-phosphate galactose phosphotransferase WbaP/exopolysaccharide biosynthesis polyprenyl glycosylphosphotransferase n=1 Tax=Acidipila rosea TaxID=768535 RepID=A0A4R1L8S1_9BACT|nr:sugar transferase [Acidipila rosea]MBW4026806.1 sugar transferase [Acidobacteriota bacterium]MBW4043385.1 sugar transferase [Acidobacteriota bacterium]TCK73687.1 Undecaprenyl-phosphate galactose phosphotransferase WbaP/exopolysaccharide biosynthesis polyprenyl glycosylphosphotransferase [Acidipila rosea]
MATSEYIRKGSSPGTAKGSPVNVKTHRRITSPALLTSALMMATDVLVVLVAFAAALLIHAMLISRVALFREVPLEMSSGPLDVIYLVWFLLALVVVSRRYGLYNAIPSGGGAHELRLTAQAGLTAGLLLCGGLYLTHHDHVSRAMVILLTSVATVSLCIRRATGRLSRYRQYEQGIETRNIVILGTNYLSNALGNHIAGDYRLGYQFRGFITAPGCQDHHDVLPEQILGGPEILRQLTRQHFIDELVIAQPCSTEEVIRLVEEARDLGIDIRAISGFFSELSQNASIEYLGVYPVVSLHRSDSRTIALFVKRLVDISLSLAALIAVFPLMVIIAAMVRLDSDGPIFYVSERIGKRGRVFPCMKFRTMVRDAEVKKKDLAALNERDGILFKLSNDPRVTRVGKFLRKYSLDELPQFFNVLRGEMSIVGPRPPIASEVAKYDLEHFRRLEVLPGLTGLWQVQSRQDSSFAKYIALDTAYVENWSFWLDLKILLRTAEVVIRGTGT